MDAIFQLAAGNILSPPVLFFILGFVGSLAGSQLTLPEAMAKTLSIYLMLAIGFKGGVALAAEGLTLALVLALLAGAVLSALIPLVAFVILGRISKLPRIDAAAVAAHYGSISIVTFVAATEAVRSIGLAPEGFMVAVAAVMETPAILVALFLARSAASHRKATEHGNNGLLQEVFLNSSVVVLMGAFVIGAITGAEGMAAIEGFIVVPFTGVLCLFLLDMGAVAGRGMAQARQVLDARLVGFGLVMPFVGAAIAVPFALLAGLSAGGTALLLTLAASASYIAVPAAMRLALPEARPSIYLSLSLGVTFPMNLTVGIPAYAAIAQLVAGG
ncbi:MULTISPECIES: sodium-dependent bicarbonate transport family permease [unclassified Roseitalea]|uniref:sodium-dependent bicarbonate transport family permease n=1 Tax=unclassified Roseitalea TaxID=2639107 RepID=UPI00273F4DA9|nr:MULTISPECIES: sodium-dependent bicarbonate transport family permease [unclassified Roseitalea]